MPALLLLASRWTPAHPVVSVLAASWHPRHDPAAAAFIVKMHGRPPARTLLFPRHRLRQVLISGEKGGTSGQTVFVGFGLASSTSS